MSTLEIAKSLQAQDKSDEIITKIVELLQILILTILLTINQDRKTCRTVHFA